MVDHELLTLAAKAAGLTLTWPDGPNDHPRITDDDGVWIWNPVDYDGDAFRLFVDCCMGADVLQGSKVAMVYKPGVATIKQPYERDPHAATRLAITRAAAEIGKTM